MTGLLHGGLAVSRRPLSLDAGVPAIVYGVGLAGPTLAALAFELVGLVHDVMRKA